MIGAFPPGSTHCATTTTVCLEEYLEKRVVYNSCLCQTAPFINLAIHTTLLPMSASQPTSPFLPLARLHLPVFL